MTNETKEPVERETNMKERILVSIAANKNYDPLERFISTRQNSRLGDFGDYCPGYVNANKLLLMKTTTKEKYDILRTLKCAVS